MTNEEAQTVSLGQANDALRLTMVHAKEMADHVADWEVQCFPLTGGDVLAMMIKFGLLSVDDAKAAYWAARERHGECDAPPTPSYNVTDDDCTPF